MSQVDITIVDLPFDFLLSVFRRLDVEDLVTLYYDSKIAEEYSMEYYGQNQGEKISRFKKSLVDAYNIVDKTRLVSIHMDTIAAPKNIKKLRAFGREMKAINIHYIFRNTFIRRYEKALEDEITNHCSETLSSIGFHCCNPYSMKEQEKPFKNAEVVRFDDSHIGSTLGQLGKWFPKMRSLQLINGYVFKASCIHKHFPELQSFQIENGDGAEIRKEQEIITNYDLKIFLSLNRQLKHLDINYDKVERGDYLDCRRKAIIIDCDLLTFINEHLKLEELTLRLEHFPSKREFETEVPMEGVRSLKVRCAVSSTLVGMKITWLNELILHLDSFRDFEWINDFRKLETFVKCAEPKRLKIVSNSEAFPAEKLLFVQMQRRLKELVVCWKYSVTQEDDAIILLTYCDNLEKVTVNFRYCETLQYEPMCESVYTKFSENEVLNEKWQLKFEYEKIDWDERGLIKFQKN